MMLPLALLLSAPVSAQEQELESRNWYLALENDRSNIIEQEFIKGANPNAVDSKGNPSLMLAIRNKSWKVVDTLLANRQTNVNIENETRETPMMYLALSYDHRLVDGKQAVTFLVKMKQVLEDPTRLVLGV